MEPSAADFHDALLRVIGSSTFRSSPRLSELLVHLVEQTLAGHADRLKGYAIALDVFGRDEGFDAFSDSIVRVQMARLRKALVEYYGGEGARDPARIVLSRGSYVPSLELAAALQQPASDGDDAAAAEPEVAAGAQLPLEAAERTGSAALEAGDVEDASPEPSPSAGATEALLPSTASPGKRRAWILLAVLALVSALVIIYWPGELRDTVVSRAGEMPRGPTVYVAPYSLTGGTAQAVHVRDGFQYDLVNYLSQLPNLAVIGLDPRGLSPTMERRARTAPRGSTFVLQGAILISGDKFRVNSSLVRVPGGVVVWSESSDLMTVEPSRILQMQADIALGVASRLGQPYGVIHETMRHDLENHRSLSMDDYFCELEAFQFMREKRPETLPPVKECLTRAVARQPNYSNAWALLSWIHTHQAVSSGAGASREALDAAERAVAANATNAQAYQYLAIARFHNGDFVAAREAIGKALAISPNNAEILAEASRLLGVLGEHDNAPALAEKAISLNPGHPAWYWSGLTIDALYRRDGQKAVRYARLGADDYGLIPRYLLASALALNQQPKQAESVLVQAAKDFPKVARDRRELIREMHMPEFISGPLEAQGLLGG
ncbi:hypothetical protein [Sphingomonas sp. IC081]|uniref:hypothetical protein n=1 Tax=Sphingomonas sp. IC081 TaxID=304378 RepID=UPI00115ACB33|nr:hypothetical protein [Sphingomonas sp. IC081]